jgi:hypothetical protein
MEHRAMAQPIAVLHHAQTESHRFFLLWRALYYLGYAIAVSLPIVLAADLITDTWMRKIVLTAISVIVGLLNYFVPGAKASVHDRAYLRADLARDQV